MAKKKIAIYGNSICSETSRTIDMFSNFPKLKLGKSFLDYLRINYDITVFGASACDPYYDYTFFEQNYKKYDKNIFLNSSFKALSVINPFTDEWVHIHNLAVAERFRERNYYDKEFSDAIVDYFKYIHDENKETELISLLKSHIKDLDEEALLIDDLGPNGMLNVAFMELSEWNIEKEKHLYVLNGINYYKDLRKGHMTKENNLIFSDKIISCIENNKDFVFDINDYQKPSKEEMLEYLIPWDDAVNWIKTI